MGQKDSRGHEAAKKNTEVQELKRKLHKLRKKLREARRATATPPPAAAPRVSPLAPKGGFPRSRRSMAFACPRFQPA